jgi:DNA end-binding protein Ku
MRAIWKGYVRFSLVTVPVRIYSAIETAETVKFNQLHKGCNGPVGYDKRCKKCDQTLTTQDIVKGYQHQKDQYVLIDPEDFDKVKLQSTKVVEIEGFVDASEIDPMLYESPYFVGPENQVAAKTYALLSEALKESGKVGIGKVVLRDREDVVAVGPHDGGLVLYRLRYPSELRSMKDVPDVNRDATVEPEQLKLARNLLDTMGASISDFEFRDKYNEALREIIEAKVQGRAIVGSVEEPRPVVDLMAALKGSIDKARSERQKMLKATGRSRGAEDAASREKNSKTRKRA